MEDDETTETPETEPKPKPEKEDIPAWAKKLQQEIQELKNPKKSPEANPEAKPERSKPQDVTPPSPAKDEGEAAPAKPSGKPEAQTKKKRSPWGVRIRL